MINEHANLTRARQLQDIQAKARKGAVETLRQFRDEYIRESNETSKVLGERYGISSSAVRMIRLRGKW